MNIKINNVLYENIQWTGNAVIMKTNMTLTEIESAFSPGINSEIIIYDNNTEIARYYNIGISSLVVTGNEIRTVEVVFDLTQIEASHEEEIWKSIATNEDAIAELAGLTAGVLDQIDKLDARILTLENWHDIMMQDDPENGIIASIISRIERLEEKGGS